MRSTRASALLTGALASLLVTPCPAHAASPAASPRPASGPRAGHLESDAGHLEVEPGSGGASMPFDLRGNHIYLRGRIGDSDSLWIVLDTGASGNVGSGIGLCAPVPAQWRSEVIQRRTWIAPEGWS